MSEIDIIKQEAIGLAVDDEDRIQCPFCKVDERSMKIHRYDTGIYYHCFRASCPNGKGFTGSLSRAPLAAIRHSTFKPKVFTRHTRVLSELEIKNIYNKYDISLQELMDNMVCKVCVGNAYVFSLFTPEGHMWGRSSKASVSPFKGPKALTYPYEESVSLAYIRKLRRPPLAILTEGMFDAIKVHRYGQGVCLLGTNFNMDMAMDLKKNGYTDIIIIALDRDAYSIATNIKKKFSLMFDTCRIARLSKDPKDLLHPQLKEELEL